jgi:hypothetical protein
MEKDIGLSEQRKSATVCTAAMSQTADIRAEFNANYAKSACASILF